VQKWYSELDENQRETWTCSYCVEHKFCEARNCYGNFNPVNFKIDNKLVQQCPISLINPAIGSIIECVKLYEITDPFNTPNVLIELKRLIGGVNG
jgi:hypothetical protein